MENLPIIVETVKKNSNRLNLPYVFTDRIEAETSLKERNEKKKGAKVEYQLYQVEHNGTTLFSVAVNPADAFGRCHEKLGAKITLLSHRRPQLNMETMVTAFDKFSEEQRQQILQQLLGKTQLPPEPTTPTEETTTPTEQPKKKGKGK